MILTLTLDQIPVGCLSVLWMLALCIFGAGLPWRAVVSLIFGETLFLALTVTGVAVSFSTTPVSTMPWQLHAGLLWISSSPAALSLAARVLARSMGSFAAMNFLALTTPLVDLMELLRRIHVPVLLVDMMATIYRSIFTLLDSMERIIMAQNTRLGYMNTMRSMHSAGTLVSRLFIEAYWRASRTQTALESRCYQGDLRVMPLKYQQNARLAVAGVLMAASLVAVRLLL
jgi:cobalt/nickel transport system permease protein